MNREMEKMKEFYEIDSNDIKRAIKGVQNRDEAQEYLDSIVKSQEIQKG